MGQLAGSPAAEVTDPNGKICLWESCENHPNRVWDKKPGCQCGAGMPCVCNRSPDIDAGIGEPDLSQILSEDVRRGD